MEKYFRAAIVVWAIGTSAYAMDTTFTEISEPAGLAYSGPSFGVAWGDFNRDGDPDLFLGNHANVSSIFQNTDGVFSNITGTVNGSLDGDLHGGAWGDIDNDGDQDLAILVGAGSGNGTGSNRILIRDQSGFTDEAVALGLDFEFGRGRTPLWFDWNNDRKLDLVFVNIPRTDGLAPTSLFTQTNTGFEHANAATGFYAFRLTSFATLFAQSADAAPLLLVQNLNPFPSALFDYSSVPFTNVAAASGLVDLPAPVWDVAAGDFDNDQQTELYLTLGVDTMMVRSINKHQARAYLRSYVVSDYGFEFAAPGQITVTTGPPGQIQAGDIKIGSSGSAPSGLVINLDSADSATWNEFAGDPATTGLFIHYDNTSQLWKVQLRDVMTIGIIVDAVSPLVDLQSVGLPAEVTTRQHAYLDQTGQTYVNNTVAAGLGAQRSCPTSAVADFDNDMDLDIYLVCSDAVGNLPNQLLENDGSGVFTSTADAAGAAGVVGGIGESVALADFDNNGFVDILVTNGNGVIPLSLDGPTQLYRNNGNDNHWLQIDLHGVLSNADGVGATVVIEAGGVTQYRLQSGGMHRHAQNHTRLHFGLGSETVVNSLEIRWPSGTTQIIQNITADQVLEVVETAFIDSDGDLIPDSTDNCQWHSNPLQTDTNSDGFGNVCDPDTNNDCIVNFADVAAFAAVFLSADDDHDFSGDGVVNFLDFSVLTTLFLQPPGPSALSSCS